MGLSLPTIQRMEASDGVVPVDLTIPGCPPSPKALLAGLLALLQTVS
jgi:Ni,Fe-hydrogenase III small subunit